MVLVATMALMLVAATPAFAQNDYWNAYTNGAVQEKYLDGGLAEQYLDDDFVDGYQDAIHPTNIVPINWR
jgi:hypothetical protein